jgi:hypothetical protein
MRKRPRNDHEQFYDWLYARVPKYDELVMRDIGKPAKKCLYAEPADVRLLPNLLRRVHAARGSERQCAKRLRMPLHRFRALSQEANYMLRVRLRRWLSSLSPERRAKERARRWHIGGWIGQISVEAWQPPAATDRWASVMHH